MDSSGMAAVFTAAAVVLLFAFMVVKGNRDRSSEIRKKILSSWGSRLPRLSFAERISHIRCFSDSLDQKGPEGRFAPVDEITARDTDLDEVFGLFTGVLSSPGEEVLYAWLRHPLTDAAEIRHRTELEDFFAADEERRVRLGAIFAGCGHIRSRSFYEAISSLDDAKPIGWGKYAALAAASVLTILTLFVNPVIFVVLLIPVLFLNFRTHLQMKREIGDRLAGLAALLRLVKASEAAADTKDPETAAERAVLKKCADCFSSLRRGSFWVLSGGSVGSGLGDAVLEYVKMLFHPDLICYDQMLKAYREHADEVRTMLETFGSLDAAMACASFKASDEALSRPVFTEGGRASLAVKGLWHPLLANPVPNDIRAERGVLLTGSNASGKSTFLKSAAIAAILAQSVGIVPAQSYEAPCFAVFTSMALSDNLSGGESYFVVEIRSLKRIWDAARRESPPVLAMVDEVLRGTNTIERIAASAQILKDLDRDNVLLFAATHDIELSYLLEEHYENMHFEETVRGGDVQFDYLLRRGRASSGNALQLIRQAGFDGKTVDDAEQLARRFEETGEWRI
ncbi:MAG: hypothetical protein J6E44_02210 [Lachnospiraceae bacterium]|nr:hypothetical protein [Lachnospiraceae bacterium]